MLAAAVAEFGQNGFHATSTATIAKRAGISQPYVYALFANKEELFLACHERVTERIRSAFVAAARGAGAPEDAFAAMGDAYTELLGRRDELLFQLQTYAAAGGSAALRERAATAFKALIDEVTEVVGVDRGEVVDFVSTGMYLNVAVALELGEDYYPVKSD